LSKLPQSTSPTIGSTANRASLGFGAPTAFQSKGSDQHQSYHPWLCNAFRLSQPLDALLHLCPPGLVSCQIRSWGCGSQRVPPPSSLARPSPRAAPPASCDLRYGTKRWRRSEERHVGNARENDTSVPLKRTTPRHRPEPFALSPPKRVKVERPIRRPRGSGIHAPGRSVHGAVVLPSARRPCLSQPLESPTRNSPSKPRLCIAAGPPLMGLLSAMDESNAKNALQSVKELEGRLASLENRRPPWGLCPESDVT